ncbi:MAG: sensor histidine kinase [Polyangiales bacterium]
MVEDQEDDALLNLRQLERSGYAVTWKRVEDAPSMRAALHDETWDIVLSDWALPQFSGPEALKVLGESGLDIPFIIVSGTVGEDAAVDSMLAGARDYIVKGRLARLSAAVERELKEHADRVARRRAEEMLVHSEKLRALGQMAAGVAHDLKNILNPILLHIQIAGRSIDRGALDDAKSSLAEMKRVLGRGVETVERLRNYSRQTPESAPEEVDLDRLVHEAREIAKPRLASGNRRMPRIVEELGAPPRFPGQPGDIVSALVNLICNSIDAMTEGGTIVLRTGFADGQIFAQVSDDGPGMPKEIEERVFEPFFTTKGEEGTGLGLAMVYACMKRHGGAVKLETAPGKGTTFTLSFPASSANVT